MRFLVTLWSSRIIINSARLSPWFFRGMIPDLMSMLAARGWLSESCKFSATFHFLRWKSSFFVLYFLITYIEAAAKLPRTPAHHYSSALFSISLVKAPRILDSWLCGWWGCPIGRNGSQKGSSWTLSWRHFSITGGYGWLMKPVRWLWEQDWIK